MLPRENTEVSWWNGSPRMNDIVLILLASNGQIWSHDNRQLAALGNAANGSKSCICAALYTPWTQSQVSYNATPRGVTPENISLPFQAFTSSTCIWIAHIA